MQIRDLLKLSRPMAEEPGRESIDELSEQLSALIKRNSLDMLMSDVPEAVSQSFQAVQRVADIVRAMKAFSHPDTRDKAAVDINAAIQTTLVVARNEIEYVATVETTLAGDLNQVFLNLLINAAHAIEDVSKKNEKVQGLAIARSAIVDKHGGEIWCESEVGTSTTFFIKLPAAPQPVCELLLG